MGVGKVFTVKELQMERKKGIRGISMHKGYAFVQFTNPFDARNACHGEDGRTVLSQTLEKWLPEVCVKEITANNEFTDKIAPDERFNT
uniref:RRM domain-containing protein n=1 Tax=Phlebotomus papatasi TaxID=29031 RepID=A0A1B0D132_PHLPP